MNDGRVDLFKNRLRKGLDLRGLKPIDLSKKTGISESSVSQYLNGTHKPKQNRVYLVAQALDVHVVWLLGYDVTIDGIPVGALTETLVPIEIHHIEKYRACDADGKKYVDYTLDREYRRVREFSGVREPQAEYFKRTIRVYDERAAAGIGNYLTDSSYEELEFPDADIPPKAEFGVRIDGDSMEPEIPDGCIVFVYPRPEIESGQIGIFSFHGKALCKRLDVNHKKQLVRLLSNNPEYPPRAITPEDYLHTF